ncbi:hypothetical protein [Virgibacillus sp. Bac330]|uniref:hypothetical protein n=1 Tax=Virgibacillus sp. Bac330 TaxID=2419841 RepID=UPI000EF51B1B|nr:hypothetical protein [Virgibacillus sp. Bac330]
MLFIKRVFNPWGEFLSPQGFCLDERIAYLVAVIQIEALLTLFDRYQVAIPEDASAKFITIPDNIKAAYDQGVEGKINNISMYERCLTYTIPADLQAVFSPLRNASFNHLQACENGLVRHS